jgi:hypothetical protein
VPAGSQPPADLLENVPEPFWWQRRWAGLSARGRRLVAAATVLVLLAAGAWWLRDRAVDQELRERVVLAASLGVWSSSTTPLGGAVGFVVVVRNEGLLPVAVTSVEGSGELVRLRMRSPGTRPVPAGGEIEIPLSVRVTCAAEPAPATLQAEIGVRREDGGSVTRRTELRPASLVSDVAATLCAVRPGLRDHELSGPVLRPEGPAAHLRVVPLSPGPVTAG